MKKLLIAFLIVTISGNFCNAQEWFTHFDVAKRMALTENKLLLVMWEDALDQPYPITFKAENGNLIVIDLSNNTEIDAVIWDHFIPVFLSESTYEDLFNGIKDKRSLNYVNKFNDDSIKIMDVNGNILNINSAYNTNYDLSSIIKNYALNTVFLKQEHLNYREKENFVTSLNLGSKYVDYALFVDKSIRFEIIELAKIYFDEANEHLAGSELPNKEALSQRLELFKIQQYLILNRSRRAQRLLKKNEESKIAEINKAMYVFLNYTTFKLLKDEKQAALWKDKISAVDLKKAELILNINK
jgi:hypothetical protein